MNLTQNIKQLSLTFLSRKQKIFTFNDQKTSPKYIERKIAEIFNMWERKCMSFPHYSIPSLENEVRKNHLKTEDHKLSHFEKQIKIRLYSKAKKISRGNSLNSSEIRKENMKKK